MNKKEKESEFGSIGKITYLDKLSDFEGIDETELSKCCSCPVPLGESKCTPPVDPISEMKINFKDGTTQEQMDVLMGHESLILRGNKIYDKDNNFLLDCTSVETKTENGAVVIDECNSIDRETFLQLKTRDND